jgi:hypothetical protein
MARPAREKRVTTRSLASALRDGFIPPPQCGRLTFVSPTALAFKPFNGATIQIQALLYAIPFGGIAGLNNTGVFVNGVPGQNLAASTLYYIYAFINNGTVTADFSTTGHTTSGAPGNAGVEIKSGGDDSRTLIGLCFANASGQFDFSASKLNVISWFNRRSIGGANTFTTARAVTATSFVEVNPEIRIEFVTWSDEAVSASAAGEVSNNVTNDSMFTSLTFDGTQQVAGLQSLATSDTAGDDRPIGISAVVSGLAEGHHFATLCGKVDAGTAAWSGGAIAGGGITAISIGVRG